MSLAAQEPQGSADKLAPAPGPIAPDRLIDTGGRSLRGHTARGTLINGTFQVALASLTFLQGFVVAAFLTRHDYGIWGILVVGLGTLSWLKGGAVSQKYVQQSHVDQQQAFQTAFTLEAILSAGLAALMALAMPVLAVVYGQWRIIAPGLLLALVVVPSAVLQTPQWIFYRNMDFVRQRLLQATSPVVGFVATVLLAVAGEGYWSLVLGALIGSLAGAIVTMRCSPYPFGWCLDRGALREYFSFSWPVTIAGAAAIGIAQGSLLIVNAVLGLAAVGAVTLAAQIVNYTDGVDAIVTGTLYPAICALQGRAALLFESFVKSNRLALMWGMPFGVGLVVFAPQLVQFVIGERWRPAIGLIQIFGLTAASHQIGFNWTAFYSARGNTRPIAIVNVTLLLTLVAAGVPLTTTLGLNGIGFALLIVTAVSLALRTYYLVRLFPAFRMWRHMLRAIAPTVPAAAFTLALRAVTGAPTTLSGAIAELAVYVTVTVAATWLFERELLREVGGYLRPGKASVESVADGVRFGVSR